MSSIKVNVNASAIDALAAKLSEAAKKVNYEVATQIQRDTEPFVPMRVGSLRQRTQVRPGEGNEQSIIYPGPYARYLYHGKKMVNAATGKGPAHYIDKQGNEVIKFPYGSRLVPAEQDLVMHHPGTTAKWLEVSKAQNMGRWEEVIRRAITRELNSN